jgi:hypothetical protein
MKARPVGALEEGVVEEVILVERKNEGKIRVAT